MNPTRASEHPSYISLLRAAASDAPDVELLRVAGEAFTYAEVLARVEMVAKALIELGATPGDRVAIMSDNLPEAVWLWLGANAAGLIDVPLNAETRGRLLEYMVKDAEPIIVAGTEQYLALLAEVDFDPQTVVAIGECAGTPFDARAPQVTVDDLLEMGAASGVTLPDPSPGDTATIMYTSGTTGPSKGVMLPQHYYAIHAAIGVRTAGLEAGEVVYCAQPLFHIDARTFLISATAARGTLALGRRFSASRFWDEVREHNATFFSCIGTMIWLLFKAPERPDDNTQPASRAISSSTPPEIHRAFEARFNCRLLECYGMTESVFIATPPDGLSEPARVGSEISELTVALLDDLDGEVGAGVVGELCFRPNEPFMAMQGYWRKPEATFATWRNLWFHTGDLLRRDEFGQLEYIGRKKDSIRRRGENVSAWEVEQAVSSHPDVLEAAAIGVPSDVGEEDVAVLVVLKHGRTLDPEVLVRFVERDLQRFAVPRYVEFVTSLPKTPSERIAKGEVRARGITADAWDAAAALGRR